MPRFFYPFADYRSVPLIFPSEYENFNVYFNNIYFNFTVIPQNLTSTVMKNSVFFLCLSLTYFLAVNCYTQELTPQKIFETYSKAVVIINCYDQSGIKKGQGSGVILEDRGIVITNFHLFAGSDKFDVVQKDTVIGYSEIIGVNIEKDIMVFKLYASDFPKISVGSSANLLVGDKVYAIGSPRGMENTISEGIVSGIRTVGKNKRNLIQITASLSSGSSGGAVFNAKGELVGISTMKIKGGENLNFMIPVDDVISTVENGLYEKQTIQALKYMYKGTDALESGNNYEAIDNFTKYIAMVPQESKAYNFRGRAHLNTKNFDKALLDFQKAIELDHSNKAAICNRGECYFLQEDYDNALADFTKVIAMDHEYYYAYFARGLTYAKLDEHKKAISDYNVVIKNVPDDVTAYINRGISHFAMEEYEKAISDWKRAIAIDPSYEKALKKNIELANFLLWNN